MKLSERFDRRYQQAPVATPAGSAAAAPEAPPEASTPPGGTPSIAPVERRAVARDGVTATLPTLPAVHVVPVRQKTFGVGLEQFDAVKAAEAGALRLKSAERLRDAVLKALARMHTVLDSQQRAQLAYLIRTGTLSI